MDSCVQTLFYLISEYGHIINHQILFRYIHIFLIMQCMCRRIHNSKIAAQTRSHKHPPN